ncbi:MAG: sulfatase-like hydrolase/transferase, partial [Bryobacteraceae bacterium]|nr:sulfatase-like hydrolase/transferase [Bryobacteraceae bacterium]
WGPGNWEVSGRSVTPCGPAYNRARVTPPAKYLSDIDYTANFEEFLERRPAGAPFCFWAGFSEPHREFEPGAGKKHGKGLAEAPVPRFLPDVDAVRSDIADYAFEIEYYDKHLMRMLEVLEKRGELENTLIAVTSDNGMAFPRAKGNLYDFGVRVPLAIRWGSRLRGGRTLDDFVRLTDLAPTFLEAAGLPSLPGTTGRSLMPLLTSGLLGQVDASRDFAVFGMERHFPGSRPDGAGYP